MDETPEQLGVRIEKERAEIREAFAHAALAWNDLENFLATLLQEVTQSKEGLAFKIYFAPNNTETRLRIIDVALRHRSDVAGIDPNSLRLCIEKFMVKLQDAQASRNKIAHYQIVEIQIGEVLHSRLMPPILNWNKEASRGLGKNEIDQIANCIRKCQYWTRELRRILGQPWPHETPQSLHERFWQLSESLKVEAPPTDAQNPR